MGQAIVVAGSKGGVAKTTLAAHLSVRAAKDGRASLIDLDPQQSLARWYELRSRTLVGASNPGLMRRGDETPSEKVAMLKRAGADWIFVDLPPSDFDLIEPGIEAADFVIIPVKASPIDLEAIEPICEVCEAEGKPFAFLLSIYDPKWKISATSAGYLEKLRKGHLVEPKFGYRSAYVAAMQHGLTGPEYPNDKAQAKACAEEVDAIWDVFKKLASRGAKR